jgi:hypothetical protein
MFEKFQWFWGGWFLVLPLKYVVTTLALGLQQGKCLQMCGSKVKHGSHISCS